MFCQAASRLKPVSRGSRVCLQSQLGVGLAADSITPAHSSRLSGLWSPGAQE